MHPNKIKTILRSHLRAGSGRNGLGSIYIEGPPGVGKSDIIRQVTEEEKVGFVDFRLLLRDPTDLRGIPVPDLTAKVANWLPPSELPQKGTHEERGIILFDDLPTASPLVQASAYQIMIWPHRLGEYQMPEGWVIVGAGNRKGEGPTHIVPIPLRNRLTILRYDLNLDDWISWAIRNNIRPEVIAFNKWAFGRESNNKRPEWPLFALDPSQSDWAFPSPRSWEKVSRKLKEGWTEDVLHEAIEGDVGKGTAIEFAAYLGIFSKIPDLDDILVNGKDIVPEELDLLYALVMAVAGYTEPDQFERCLEYSWKLTPEFRVLLVKSLAAKDKKALTKCEGFPKWAQAHSDLILE